MSTQWQKSCIEALTTSPTAFKLFRIQQRNVKQTDQFIGRVWAYTKKDKKENESELKGIGSIIPVMECLIQGINSVTPRNDVVHLHNEPNNSFNGKEMLIALELAISEEAISNICSMGSPETDFYLVNGTNSTRDIWIADDKPNKNVLYAIRHLIKQNESL